MDYPNDVDSGEDGNGLTNPDTESPSEDSGENTVILSADMFGGVTPKEGDRITFCVTKPVDSEGNVAGYFMGSEDKGSTKDQSSKWDSDMIAAVSPRNSGESAQ